MDKLPDKLTFIEGGVCAPKGFKASGVHAGFRKNASRKDLALVFSDAPCATAATFTKNVFCAAPVLFDKAQFEASSGNKSFGEMQAVVINSGNANAATGELGMQTCINQVEIAEEILGCPKSEVLIASTGVIGVQLPLEPFKEGLPRAKDELSYEGGTAAAEAIMTTDLCSKECAVVFSGEDIGYPGCEFKVGGMAKGSGMIMPNMATMIALITTDAPIKANDLYAALLEAVENSFNKVTVDSDTSTNDTCIAMASGAATSGAHFAPGSAAYARLLAALQAVCVCLARKIARDGEGATRLIDVIVRGAKSEADADVAARTIANSPLVKTAIAGRDANWGRIAAALGQSGAEFNQQDVDISIMGIEVCRGGLALDFDEQEALSRFENDEIEIEVDLHAGDFSTCIWTCDFTHEYISINADYRT